MTITLFDVVDKTDYDAAVAARYIKTQTHPTLPYIIHNYTDAATWDQAWTPAVMACRGLITHTITDVVVARSYDKFFNADQPQAPVFTPDEPVIVMDKTDGSLGVLVPTPEDGHIIATRGSFTSDQAVWATHHYNTHYAHQFTPNPDWTYLYEIVYAANRIVLTYDFDDLVLLGARDITTGQTVPLEQARTGWPGRVVDVFPYTTIREAFAAPDRVNAEGFVIWSPTRDVRTKYKQADYKIKHKYLTGTTPRHVWEVLAAGDDPAVVFADAPDEWHTWVRTVIAGLRDDYTRIDTDARTTYDELIASLPDGWERKDFALAASKSEHRALLFLLLDDRPLDDSIWKQVRPAGERTFKAVSGDAD